MKINGLVVAIAISGTIILTAMLFNFHLTGCNGEPTCCPEVTLSAMPIYVCNPECVSGSGKTTLTGYIAYKNLKTNKECKPTKDSVSLTANYKDPATGINKVDNLKIPNQSWTPPGPRQFFQTESVDKPIWFELTDFSCSDPKLQRVEVKPLPANYSYDLCTAHGDYRGLASWQFPGDKEYGKGIVIIGVENPKEINKRPNQWTVKLSYGSEQVELAPGEKSDLPYANNAIGKGWQLTITNFQEWEKNKEDFCIKVYLMCSCKAG
jgi:hypothetical protein